MQTRSSESAGSEAGIDIGTMTESKCSDECLNDDLCVSSEWDISSEKCSIFYVSASTSSNSCCTHFEKSCKGKLTLYIRVTPYI